MSSIIMFHPLDEKQIRKIVDLKLERVQKRLEEKKITLTISSKAKDWLGEKGFDPDLGARPLKRVVQSELLDPLAMKIIEGNIEDGDSVKVGVEKGELVVQEV